MGAVCVLLTVGGVGGSGLDVLVCGVGVCVVRRLGGDVMVVVAVGGGWCGGVVMRGVSVWVSEWAVCLWRGGAGAGVWGACVLTGGAWWGGEFGWCDACV